jgi:hypothetical protein
MPRCDSRIWKRLCYGFDYTYLRNSIPQTEWNTDDTDLTDYHGFEVSDPNISIR